MKLTSFNEMYENFPDDRKARIQSKIDEMTKVIEQHNEPEQVTIEHINQSIELSKLRKSHQLKQSELAELMGVSQANISKLERG